MEQIVWARDIFHHILYFPMHKVAQTSSSKAALEQRLAPTSAVWMLHLAEPWRLGVRQCPSMAMNLDVP